MHNTEIKTLLKHYSNTAGGAVIERRRRYLVLVIKLLLVCQYFFKVRTTHWKPGWCKGDSSAVDCACLLVFLWVYKKNPMSQLWHHTSGPAWLVLKLSAKYDICCHMSSYGDIISLTWDSPENEWMNLWRLKNMKIKRIWVNKSDHHCCHFQLCFRLLPHPILCGPSEGCQAHLSCLQDCTWGV